MTVFIISLLVFSIFYAISDAVHDYAVIEAKNGMWHKVDAVIKTSVAAYVMFLLYWLPFKMGASADCFWCLWWVAFIILGIRWIVFDLTLNILRGKKWYYVEDHGINGFLGSWSFYAKAAVLFFIACMVIEYLR